MTTTKVPKVYVPPTIPHKKVFSLRLAVYLSVEQHRRLAALVNADKDSNCCSEYVRKLIDGAFDALARQQQPSTPATADVGNGLTPAQQKLFDEMTSKRA